MKLKLVDHENDIKLPNYSKHWAEPTGHEFRLHAEAMLSGCGGVCRGIPRLAGGGRSQRLAPGQTWVGVAAALAAVANLGQVSIVFGTSPVQTG